MRNWVLLLGLAVVLVALLMAGGQGVLAHDTVEANATLARVIFTIPLAASPRL